MTIPKTLVIGSTGHTHVTCVAWENLAITNVRDFDIIVANVKSLSDDFLAQCKHSFFETIRTVLSSWLLTGGELIIMGEKMRQVAAFSNYSWLPVHIGITPEEGTTITAKTSSFKKYMERFASSPGWQFFYSLSQPCLSSEIKSVYGQIPDTEYKISLNPIAENRSQDVLSGTVEISIKGKDGEELQLNPIILLPAVDGLEEREAVNMVLEDRLSLPQGVLPPAWVDAVAMPLVDDIQAAMDEKKRAIAVLEQEIVTGREEKHRLEGFKKLLYSSGQELETLFANCLELLGGKIAPPKHSGEKMIFAYKKQLYFVECSGVQKSVSLSPIRQLMDDMFTFEEEEGYAAKGILFGNAWNALPPEHRGESDTVIFPDNIVKRAEALDIALVSSIAFFDAFCDFLAGKTAGEDILDQIISTAGIVEFTPPQVQPLRAYPALEAVEPEADVA